MINDDSKSPVQWYHFLYAGLLTASLFVLSFFVDWLPWYGWSCPAWGLLAIVGGINGLVWVIGKLSLDKIGKIG